MASHQASLPLICPACTDTQVTMARGEEASASWPLQLMDEATYRCCNPACQKRFPIRLGIPLLHPAVEAFCAAEERALRGETELGQGRGLDFFAAYSWAAWADHIPPEEATTDLHEWALRYRHRIGAKLDQVVAAASQIGRGLLLDAGCGLGRETRELAIRAFRQAQADPHSREQEPLPTLGLDLRFEALLWATRNETTGRVRWCERLPGQGYCWRAIAPEPGPSSARFLLADLFRPPLPRGSVAGAIALNVLDNTPDPLLFLERMGELLLPGALLLVTTPFAWSEAITPVEILAELGPPDGPGFWAAAQQQVDRPGRARSLPYTLAEQPSSLRWVLRKHARDYQIFQSHLLLLRRTTD